MSIKILLDPIYSSTTPGHCSCAYKYRQIVEYFLERRNDVFFYWLVPNFVSDEDREWLPKHPNIKYLTVPAYRDRMREYMTVSKELDSLIAFNGKAWDYDVLITTRTPMASLYRILMNSPRSVRTPWMKQVLLEEEMYIMRFRPSVSKSDLKAQETQVLTGYLNSDGMFYYTEEERTGILNVARQYFSPSTVLEIQSKMYQAVAVPFREATPKPEQYRYVRGKRPFCLTYAGRLDKHASNLNRLYKIMTSQWVLNGDASMKVLVCTVSKGVSFMPPEFVEVLRPNREEFWKRAVEQMDLILWTTKFAEFSLALVEPMLLGVPAIVPRASWSEGFLGKEYPFYANSETTAFAFVKDFQQNYEVRYKEFLDWQQNVFAPMFQPGGPFAKDLYAEMYDKIVSYNESMMQRVRDTFEDRAKANPILQLMVQEAGDEKEFAMFDVLKRLSKKGEIRTLDDKLREDDRESRGIVWATPWNDFRLLLKAVYGYEDASVKLGHLRKVQ